MENEILTKKPSIELLSELKLKNVLLQKKTESSKLKKNHSSAASRRGGFTQRKNQCNHK